MVELALLFWGHITAHSATTLLLFELGNFYKRIMSRKVLPYEISFNCLFILFRFYHIAIASTLPGLSYKCKNRKVCPQVYFSINLHTFQPLFSSLRLTSSPLSLFLYPCPPLPNTGNMCWKTKLVCHSTLK